MEFESTDPQSVEKALKDLVDQSKNRNTKIGQRFVKKLNLDCGRKWGSFADQIKKRLKRDLTPEEKWILDYYYRLICQLEAAAAARVIPPLERVREGIQLIIA